MLMKIERLYDINGVSVNRKTFNAILKYIDDIDLDTIEIKNTREESALLGRIIETRSIREKTDKQALSLILEFLQFELLK